MCLCPYCPLWCAEISDFRECFRSVLRRERKLPPGCFFVLCALYWSGKPCCCCACNFVIAQVLSMFWLRTANNDFSSMCKWGLPLQRSFCMCWIVFSAGHGEYSYQQSSYGEQGYDRSFDESSQHYYEGGNSYSLYKPCVLDIQYFTAPSQPQFV